MALHPALRFGPVEQGPAGPTCEIRWGSLPVARLYRTDQPETEAWEPGMPGPAKLPGFTCYTVRSLRTGAVLSGLDRDAVLGELADRLAAAMPAPPA